MKRTVFALMFSLVVAGGAFAADLPQPPAPQAPATYVPVVAPVYNWGGIYVGINGGYGFGSTNWTDPSNPFGSTGSFNIDGFLVGGTLGFNYQMNALVFGVEGDFDWQSLSGSNGSSFCTSVATAAAATGLSCQTKSDWLGTIRGRVGYASDRVLFYGTAGGAFGNVQTGLNGLSLQSSTEFGWTAGGGVEVAFADNWTARVEYLYVDLESPTCNTAGSCGFDTNGAAANDTVKFTESVVRLGVDYKFNF